jgi:hypothetical protein
MHEIPVPETPRLHGQPKEPFESMFAHPDRRSRHAPGVKIKRRADADQHRNAELLPVFEHPALLFRGAKANPYDVRARAFDARHSFAIFLRGQRAERRAADSGNTQARESRGKACRETSRRRWPSVLWRCCGPRDHRSRQASVEAFLPANFLPRFGSAKDYLLRSLAMPKPAASPPSLAPSLRRVAGPGNSNSRAASPAQFRRLMVPGWRENCSSRARSNALPLVARLRRATRSRLSHSNGTLPRVPRTIPAPRNFVPPRAPALARALALMLSVLGLPRNRDSVSEEDIHIVAEDVSPRRACVIRPATAPRSPPRLSPTLRAAARSRRHPAPARVSIPPSIRDRDSKLLKSARPSLPRAPDCPPRDLRRARRAAPSLFARALRCSIVPRGYARHAFPLVARAPR